MTEQPTRILYCHCAHANVVPSGVRRAVRSRLSASGVAFEPVADLCALAARHDPALKRIAGNGPVKIVACFPRAVKWLFHAAGAPLPDEGVEILNMREQDVDGVVSRLLSDSRPRASGGQEPVARSDRQPGAWYSWFPVIDYDRCTNCMQCLSFCLFDVFDEDEEGRVRVRHPDHCKPDCPACARVCPEVAIIFPKHATGPINGDEVREHDLSREAVKVDISALLGGDACSSLRTRGRKARRRFSAERDDSRALADRRREIEKFSRELGIPHEVLESLTTRCVGEDGAERFEPGPAERSAVPGAAGGRTDAPSAEEWDI